jgi:hypothetical protein
MLTAPKRLGSIRVPRVVFGVRVSGTLPQRGSLCSPNRVFRRDAGNCTRGRAAVSRVPRQRGLAMRSPDLATNRGLSVRMLLLIF